MFYKDVYIPRVSDFDRKGKLSYEAILQILEAAGSRHSAMANDNVIEESQQGIAWVLVDWRVSILRRVNSTEELNITTWVRGGSGCAIVYRDFVLTDKTGKEVIKAEAKICLLNIDTGKLIRIGDEMMSAYEPEERTVFDSDVPRLRAPIEFMNEHRLFVRRGDIDFNGHVHNTCYIEYALEAIPQDVFDTDAFSNIRIVYSKPIKEKSIVTARYALTETGYFVGIYDGEVLCTLIELK